MGRGRLARYDGGQRSQERFGAQRSSPEGAQKARGGCHVVMNHRTAHEASSMRAASMGQSQRSSSVATL